MVFDKSPLLEDASKLVFLIYSSVPAKGTCQLPLVHVS